MLIWRGYGIMVVVFAVVGLVAGKVFNENVWGAPVPVDKRQWGELFGMILAAALVYVFHLLTQRPSDRRIVIDKRTGKEEILEKKHDLFFIPIKYWSVILIGLGVMLFFKR